VNSSTGARPKPRWTQWRGSRRHLAADAAEDLRGTHDPLELQGARPRARGRGRRFADTVFPLPGSVAVTARERAVRAAMLAYQQRDAIRYSQHHDARWDGIRNGRRADDGKFPRWADASSFVTWCLWDALGGPHAGPDIVNGLNWTTGYTGTMLEHGHEVPLASAQPGDLVLMGHSRRDINHVTIVVAPGRVLAHGHPTGPLLLPIDYPRAGGGIQMVRRYLP
jgi:hypothetical protein